MSTYRIDLSAERLIGRKNPEVARLFDGKSPSPAAFSAWTKHGVRGVRLPSVLVGGRRLTSPGALAWWIRRINPEDGASIALSPQHEHAAMQREHEIACAIALLDSPNHQAMPSPRRKRLDS